MINAVYLFIVCGIIYGIAIAFATRCTFQVLPRFIKNEFVKTYREFFNIY